MKKYISTLFVLIFVTLLSTLTAFSQVITLPTIPPRALTYQAEARDDKGGLLKEQFLTVYVKIYADTEGNLAWENTYFDVFTDKYGLFTLVLGDPNGTDHRFNTIEWNEYRHFLNVVVDYRGDQYDLGTAQLLSVPYALHALTAQDADYATEALSAEEVEWPNITYLPPGFADGIDNVIDADADASNELQLLAVSDYQLSISGGNSVDLPIFSGDFDDLSNKPNVITEPNILIGPGAGNSSAQGIDNIAIGDQALSSLTTGSENIAIGSGALHSSTIGTTNSAVGFQSLYSLEVSFGNTALGYKSLYTNTSGNSNVSVGNEALLSNTIGNYNIAIGYWTLKDNISGAYNTAAGAQALQNNTIGNSNTATGHRAMHHSWGGDYNTAQGVEALNHNWQGNDNTATGYRALYSAGNGNRNTAIGSNAGHTNSSDDNVFLGYSAGYHETGSNKLFIDNQPRGGEAEGRTESLIYGEFAENQAEQVFAINGNVGIGTISPGYNLDVVGDININGSLFQDGNPFNTDDADADPLNELQALEFNQETGVLKIAQANEVDLNSLSTDLTLADIQQMYNELRSLIESNHSEVMSALNLQMDIEDLIRAWQLGEVSVLELYKKGYNVGTLKQMGATNDELTEAGLAGTVTDRDGNTYKWVKIGADNWMAENLRITHFNDGQSIQLATNIPYPYTYTYPNNNSSYVESCGLLYSIGVVQDPKGVCPDDWHIANEADFNRMLDFIGRDSAGIHLKERGTAHWSVDNGSTNSTGFLARGAGYCITDALSEGVLYWSDYKWSTGFWIPRGGRYFIFENRPYVRFIDSSEVIYTLLYSIRCVQNR